MSKPDIEVLDDSEAYPYSSHISVDGTELQFGDLLLVFESGDNYTVNFFERVYGFTWPGVITHVIDGPVPAEFREFESIAERLKSGEIAVAPEHEQTSYFVDEDTIRAISIYQYGHQDGWQPILVDEHRDPFEETPSKQEVFLCSDIGEVIEELFENHPLSDEQEAEQLRDFLMAAGCKPDSLSTSENQ